MTISTRQLLSASIVASAAWLGATSAADAANITYDRVSNSYFIVDGSQGGQGVELNSITAQLQGGKVVLADTATPLTSATSRCVIVAAAAHCPTDGAFQFFLGGGNDTLDYRIPQPGRADLGDGVDALFGSHRQFGPASATFLVTGGQGFDYAVFSEAPAGVNITDNDTAPDGVAGQNYSVSGFEGYAGSAFGDRILASPEADVITPGGGDDIVGAGFGDDVIVSQARDGADDIHGGPGSDWIHYSGRTQGITLASNELADDGEPFERDFIRTNVENAVGTDHDDRIFGSGAANRYQGAAGNDRLEGAGGADTLTGASGVDTLIGDIGNDTIDARDNERDIVSCGADADLALRDAAEAKVSGCETDQVGTLRLADTSLTARAGQRAELGLSWTHPKAWKELESVELRVTDNGAVLGTLTVEPATGKVSAKGGVKLEPRKTTIQRVGKLVKVAPTVRFSDKLVGRDLSVDVEATDRRGHRQAVTAAATLTVR